MREKGDEQRISEDVLLSRDLPPVHVHSIAQSLECVEGYAHREEDVERLVQSRNAKRSQSSIEVPEQEVKIFEEDKDPDIGDKAAGHDPFPVRLRLVKQAAAHIGDDG